MTIPNAKYKVNIPLSLPLTVPFTIRPNSLLGVHVKYWIFPLLVAIAGIIFCIFSFSDIALYLSVPLIVTAGFIVWLIWTNMKNSLTVTPDALTYVKNGSPQVIAMTDLALVEWGLTYAGTRLYYVLYIRNKKGDTQWKFSVLNFWNTRELRTVYTSVPQQYQGAQDVQPF